MNEQEALNALYGEQQESAKFETAREKRARLEQEMLRQRLTTIRKFEQDVKRVAVMPEGVELLKFIFDLCGIHESPVYASQQTGAVDAYASMYNHGRANVWRELRKRIPPDVLAEIEKPPQEDYSCLETKPQETQVAAPL